MNCFECEVGKACKNFLIKIIQIKYYSTEIHKLKRLHDNELGYM